MNSSKASVSTVDDKEGEERQKTSRVKNIEVEKWRERNGLFAIWGDRRGNIVIAEDTDSVESFPQKTPLFDFVDAHN